jgi:alpha-L-fucosidase
MKFKAGLQKKSVFLGVALILYLTLFFSCQQRKMTHFVIISADDTGQEIVQKAGHVTPSARQLSWQEMELTAFVHFSINTFTDREWGVGDEDPQLFNPNQLDAKQWARVFKEAGMKMIILTTKHHDGFCLWPTRYTDHSVKTSPWRNGNGDVVQEVAEACREFGLKLGIYLSPWDRHEPSYGNSPRYNEFFKNQLRELLTNYGEVAEVWFDGACGEGPNGKRQVYDWPGYYKVIRELQPHAVIAIMGPDVRWVGTESGYGRETEWSVVPSSLRSLAQMLKSPSQEALDSSFLPMDLTQADLGSRDKIIQASALAWYPSEVDVSIRPGWFYHQSQDGQVKSPEKLFDIYFSSVGRNSVLLLNVPPDRRGLIHENDIQVLGEWRRALDETFRINFAEGAQAQASNAAKGHSAQKTIDGDKKTYWTTEGGKEAAVLEYRLAKPSTFDVLMLQENIRIGQRIEHFQLEAWINGSWEKVTEGTTIGYKRLLRFPATTTDRVRLSITESRTNPTLSHFGLYNRRSN